MTDQKDWRDANMPKWAREAMQAEIEQWKLTAALSWPTESKPEPLPFRWGEYDSLKGEPKPGRYWVAYRHRVESFELTRVEDLNQNIRETLFSQKEWAFKKGGNLWKNNVARGPLFSSERDARLYRRWLMCEDFAAQLLKASQ